jgi:hypothetical protein
VEFLSDWYREIIGKRLDLEHPRTFNEKIQWMKLYDSTPLKTRLADKYLVRDWVAEKIGPEYLIPLLGVWDSFDEIDFNELPNQFVLKANHGCGWNIIVKDKSRFNKEEARRNFDYWMRMNFAYCAGLELHYRNIPPKIIVEKYMEDENKQLVDYKFYCFEGKPYFIEFLSDRFEQGGFKCTMYDLEWNPTGWTPEALHEPCNIVTKPKNLTKMIYLAKMLCFDFHYVRVDFYSLDEKVYFGEMTFTPMSGLGRFKPKEWDLKLGEMIKL